MTLVVEVQGPIFLTSTQGIGEAGLPDHILFFKTFYLFIFRERGREGEREAAINVWLPLMHPPLGTWPTIQACALTGNQTGDPLVRRLALSPLSYTSQGQTAF